MIILRNSGGDMRHFRDRSFHGSNHDDDNNLWLIIQRVCRREDEISKRVHATIQLKEFITNRRNELLLSRNLEAILNALIDVFFERNGISLQKDVANVIGLIGHQLSNEVGQFFQWLLRQFQSIANDNVRNYLLESLHSLLKLDDGERKFEKVIEMLMDELQGALENIDSPEHLPFCINPLVLIAQNYPTAFNKNFHDTVDILVGWHIDHTQKMSLTLFASKSLINLHFHWLRDLRFSVTLLSQFIEDMEAYAEDFHKLQNGETVDDDTVTAESCLLKMAALMRVFSTVVRGIGPIFHANNGPPITESFLLETLHRIIECAQLAGDGSLAVTRAADECARLLLGAVQWRGEDMLSDILLTYAVHAVERSRSESRLLLVLDFTTVMVQEVGSALPAWFIQGLLGPSSRLLPLKHARNPILSQELLALYQACLAVKSVPLLQTAYKYVAGEMQHSINALLAVYSSDKTNKLQAIADNPFETFSTEQPNDSKDVEDMEVDIIESSLEEHLVRTATFDIGALLEVGDAKNSIIGMYALSPSIFNLLHTVLKVVHSHISAIIPCLQYAVLQALYSHCQRHKNFLSSFLGGSAAAPSVDSVGGNFIDNVTTATHGHYPIILELIADLLIKKTTSKDARTLLLHWSSELLEKLKTNKDMSLLNLSSLTQLIQSLVMIGVQEDLSQSKLAAQCLRIAVEATSDGPASLTPMATFLHHSVTQCCLTQMWNIDGEIQKEYSQLLLTVPMDKVMEFSYVDGDKSQRLKSPCKHIGKQAVVKSVQLYGHRQSWLAKRAVANKTGTPTIAFHSHHFKDLMEKLLKHGNGISSAWIGQLYWSCQRRDSLATRLRTAHSRTEIAPLAAYDQSFLHWWAVWKAAEFTVTNKLRTPLGRPQDTFQKIEGAIREVCENKLTSIAPSASKIKDSPRMPGTFLLSVLQRPHLLLLFLDNLEKLLYNAYEGCAVAIPPPTKAVRTFFYTNKQTCEQWLNRLRLAVMKTSLSCGLSALTFQHGQVILHDMKTKNNTSGFEFESAIAMTVEALINLASPHAVEGVYRWCRELGGTKQQWAWMKAAKQDAFHNYEDAAKEYKQILTSTSRKPPDGDGKSNTDREEGRKVVNPARLLISQQLVKCYSELSSWEDLQRWLKQQASDDAVQSLSSLSTKPEYIAALSYFENKDLQAASEKSLKLLTEFSQKPHRLPLNGGITRSSTTALTWPDLLRISKAQSISSLQMVKKGVDVPESFTAIVEPIQQQVLRSTSNCVKLSTSYWPPDVDEECYLMFAATSAIKKLSGETSSHISLPLSGSLNQSEWMAGSAANHLLSLLQNGANPDDAKVARGICNLRMGMVKASRRHNNNQRARDLLLQQIAQITKDKETSDSSDLLKICQSLPINNTSLPLTLRLQYESSKLLHATGHTTDSITLLAGSLVTYFDSRYKNCGDLSSRALLTLVKYLQADWKNTGPTLKNILQPDEAETEGELVTKLRILLNIECRSPLAFASNTQLISEVNHEVAIGSLLNLATIQAPDMAKAWFTMAGWCYKWGRKIMDQASSAGSVELTGEEKQEVQTILLPLGVGEEQLEEVYGVLRKAHCSTTSIQVEGDALDDITVALRSQQNYTDISDVVIEQLNSRCGAWLARAPSQVSHALLTVWQHVCVRLFTQYRLAAHAYFQFLSLNAGDQTCIKYEDCDVTATLRLLRLLVKHALELQSTLKKGFATTPTAPWKGIIPQLFSRLNHPESYVRRSIADLLCRVGRQSSHLIVYPVVVATMQSDPRANSGLGVSLEEQEDIDEENERNKQEEQLASEDLGAINSCYQQVIQALMEQNDSTVRDVQLLVAELRRITLLWDELWLGTLNQHQHDIMKRLQQLQDEAKRVNGNNTLSKTEKENILREQQQAIMRPVVYALGRVQLITCATPETPHERWFADNIQNLIEQAMEQLKKPPNPHDPNSCWSGFKQVHSLLQNRASKRASHMLNLGEISPRLMTLKSTSMSIPGVTDASHPVTIEGCSSAVTILPTKTKPKKLQFIGSDGRRYTYLFKGLEDLHLDERIMQFLSIANRLLHRQHENRGYLARHYSVTPLGTRSGLIQWVSGATPLFLLYKRWQQRQAINQANKQAVANNASSTSNTAPNIQIMRPSDLYYSKLNPAMKKAGVDMDRMNRKDWPIEVMRSVLKELLTDTPDDLLQKELWCSATGAPEFWDLQQKYTQSTAVMSMIGYVIGLGDRHLDNVLVDLETGEVVHIDYNVCFEKGLQLRVPERVPFRLTQNLLRALGLTGVEGIFRNSCEQVMSTLRKGKETLLTLLEAFVYDPLVDWTGTVEGGYAGAVYGGGAQQATAKAGEEEDKLSKKDMEREITRSLFSSRVAEMKQGWFTNRDEMLKALPVLVDKLNEYKKYFKNNIEMNESIENYLEVKSKVKTALSDVRHPYNNLPQRWHQHQQQQKKRESTLNTLQDKISSCEESMKRYGLLLSVLQSPELAALLAEATTKIDLGSCAFEHASSFLHSAGQANMVAQAQMTEKELVTVNEQRRHAMQSCLDALSQYAAISAHFPPQGALRCHSEAVWRKRLEQMVDGLLNLDCSPARAEVERSHSKETIFAQTRAASKRDGDLQREVNDLNNELLKLIERRNREPVAVGRMPEAERLVNSSRDLIVTFVQDHGLDGLGAFTGVLTMLLCTHDQRAIAMETTAANAGHRLMDMTSKEGDWFLEELCGLFANMVQLLHLGDSLLTGASGDIKPPNVTRETTLAVMCVDRVYRTLLELFNNFRNIIVPEAVKLLQCEEPSVIELVSAVNGILQGVRLEDLTKQLMGNLRSQGAQNGISVSYEETLSAVQILQGKYDQLLQDSRQKRSDEQRLTAGQMLLQAFDGLFRSVVTDFNALLSARDHLYATGCVPQEWSFVDMLSKPLQLQKFKKLSGATDSLQALLFVEQLQAMHNFFALCQSNVRAFVVDRLPSGGKNTIAGHHYTASKGLYSEERLAKPIKYFISHFIQELLVGIPSEMLGCAMCGLVQLLGVDLTSFAFSSSPVQITEDLCKAATETKYTQSFVAKPTMLVYHFNRAWKEYDRAQRLDSNIIAVRSSLQRAQLQVTRFQWLHEDLLESSGTATFARPRRCDVINDLNKRMSTLRHLEGVLKQVQEKATMQNTSVQQRLKWAAGANPSLQTVLSSVESDAQSRATILKKESTLSLKIVEICENAIAFERSRLTLRDTSNNHDSEFLRLLDTCEAVCRVITSTPVKIDDQERTAVEVLPPKQGLLSNSEWLQKLSEKLQTSVQKFRHQRQQEESKMSLVKSNLRDLVTSVKQLLSSHGRLLADVKALLKTMAKEEDTDGDIDSDSSGVGSVRKYMERYKELTSSLNDALMDVLQGCDASTMLDPDPLIERLMGIFGEVAGVYEDLVAFASPYLESNSNRNQPTFASALRTGTSLPAIRNAGAKKSTALPRVGDAYSSQSAVTPNTPPLVLEGGGGSASVATESSAPSKSLVAVQGSGAAPSPKKKVRDPKTGKAIQERNYFAMSVWRKVKSKLDGRDQDVGKRMQVTEQVEHIISEATSLDNLALLYEGWTAWV